MLEKLRLNNFLLLKKNENKKQNRIIIMLKKNEKSLTKLCYNFITSKKNFFNKHDQKKNHNLTSNTSFYLISRSKYTGYL